MKICSDCGEELDDKFRICPYCGNALDEGRENCEQFMQSEGRTDNGDAADKKKSHSESSGKEDKKPLDVFGMVGMIVGIVGCLIGWFADMLFGEICAMVGVIFSSIGRRKRNECSLYGFSYAGLAVSITTAALIAIFWIANYFVFR